MRVPTSAKTFQIGLFWICFILFIRQTFLCVFRFLSEETSISMEIRRSGEVTFPAITVCSDYSTSYKQNVLQSKNITVEDFRRNFVYPNVTDLTKFYLDATYNLSELVKTFFVQTENVLAGTTFTVFWFDYSKSDDIKASLNQRKMFLPFDTNDWTSQHFNTFGRCHTFHPPDWILRLNVLNIEFTFLMETEVFVHHPGQFSHTDTKTKVKTFRNQNIYIQIDHELTHSLPRLDDTKEGPKENSGQVKTCLDDLNEGYDDCIKHETFESMVDKYKCYPPFFPVDNNNSADVQECRINELTPVALAGYRDTFLGLYQEGVRKEKCVQPCDTMSVVFGYPSKSESANHIGLKLYFKNHIAVSSSSYTYKILTLFADLGGYLGLLLGYSCRDLASIVDMLLNKIKR